MNYREFQNIVDRPRVKSLPELRKALDFANKKYDESRGQAEATKLKVRYMAIIQNLESEITRVEDMKEPDSQL